MLSNLLSANPDLLLLTQLVLGRCCPIAAYDSTGIGNCSLSARTAGGPSSGAFSQAHKSRKMNSCWRSSAARLESDQPSGRGYQNLRYLLLKAQRIAATKTEFMVFRKAA